MDSSPDLALLLVLIDQGYDKKAWHGPNLRGAIRGLTDRQAAWRPAPGRHSIQEVTVHAAYWKYAVRRRITGERRGSFPLKGSNWFARTAGTGPSWNEDIMLLADCHRTLREAVAALAPDLLFRPMPGSKVRMVDMIAGIAAHDIYHAGQIQLLKRLQRAR